MAGCGQTHVDCNFSPVLFCYIIFVLDITVTFEKCPLEKVKCGIYQCILIITLYFYNIKLFPITF